MGQLTVVAVQAGTSINSYPSFLSATSIFPEISVITICNQLLIKTSVVKFKRSVIFVFKSHIFMHSVFKEIRVLCAFLNGFLTKQQEKEFY